MKSLEQLRDHKFTTVDWPIVGFLIRVAEIAERIGLKEETWEEDGLGKARGLLVRLPSGRVVLLRELDHAIEHLGAKGPFAHVDASDVAACGVESLAAEIVDALELPRETVGWVAPNESQDSAVELLDRIRRSRAHDAKEK